MSTRKLVVAALTAALMVAGAAPALAHGGGGSSQVAVSKDLLKVRKATVKYHRIQRAAADGYVPFAVDPADPNLVAGATCFDSPEGGMGIHMVKGIDDGGALTTTRPEALVYEVGKNYRLRLVGVEYIVLPDDYTGQTLFGQPLTEHPTLGVWKLHAYVWRWNPLGTFADFNPRVRDCPS